MIAWKRQMVLMMLGVGALGLTGWLSDVGGA